MAHNLKLFLVSCNISELLLNKKKKLKEENTKLKEEIVYLLAHQF